MIIYEELSYKHILNIKRLNHTYAWENYSSQSWDFFLKYNIGSFIALDGDKYVGYIIFVSHGPSLRELYYLPKKGYTVFSIVVHPDYRNNGIATNLLKLSLNSISSVDKNPIYITVRKSNKHAIKLYKKFGFIIHKKLKQYYFAGPIEDAYDMIRKPTKKIIKSK